jgi:hypothetical protein
MAKRALVLTFGSAALAALTGAGFPVAMVCPELGPLGIARDIFEKPVSTLTIAHGGSAKSPVILPKSFVVCDKKPPIFRGEAAICRIQPRNKEMPELELKEARELLIGTWIGIALLADTLIEHGVLSREELLLPLSQTEEAASDKRRTALAGLRLLISRGFRCTPHLDPAKAEVVPRRSGHPRGCRRSPLLRPANARSYQSYATGNFRAFTDIGVNKRHKEK